MINLMVLQSVKSLCRLWNKSADMSYLNYIQNAHGKNTLTEHAYWTWGLERPLEQCLKLIFLVGKSDKQLWRDTKRDAKQLQCINTEMQIGHKKMQNNYNDIPNHHKDTKNNYKETRNSHKWCKTTTKRPKTKMTTQRYKLRRCKTTTKRCRTKGTKQPQRRKTTANQLHWDAKWPQRDGQQPQRIRGRNRSLRDTKQPQILTQNNCRDAKWLQRDTKQSQRQAQCPCRFPAPISVALHIFSSMEFDPKKPFYFPICNLKFMSGWWRCCHTFSSLRQSG